MKRAPKAPERTRSKRRLNANRPKLSNAEEASPLMAGAGGGLESPATTVMDGTGDELLERLLWQSPRLNSKAVVRFHKMEKATERFLNVMDGLSDAGSSSDDSETPDEGDDGTAGKEFVLPGIEVAETAPEAGADDLPTDGLQNKPREVEVPVAAPSMKKIAPEQPQDQNSSTTNCSGASSSSPPNSGSAVPGVNMNSISGATEGGASIGGSRYKRDLHQPQHPPVESITGTAKTNSRSFSAGSSLLKRSASLFSGGASAVTDKDKKSLLKRKDEGKTKDGRQLVLGGKAVADGQSVHDIPALRRQAAKDALRTLKSNLRRAEGNSEKEKTGGISVNAPVRNGRSLLELLFGTVADLPATNLEDDSTQDWYRKTAGMHTVQKWLENYQKHPYGWGALMMIHGTDEVCFRLRTKVENYAVYAALFLSASLVLILAPQESVSHLCEREESERMRKDGEAFWWVCHVQIRLYFYSLGVATCLHVLAIRLAMAFINAFNEAGRDCDIIRMFGEGKGYLATVKCEKAFTYGLLALAIALFDAIWIFLTIYDAIGISLLLVTFCYYGVYKDTVKLLFESSSIMHYWRWGRGHASGRDPFLLSLPIERLQQKAAVSRLIHAQLVDDVDGIWNIT